MRFEMKKILLLVNVKPLEKYLKLVFLMFSVQLVAIVDNPIVANSESLYFLKTS